eukprot:3846576-Pyramimonas_sp.AAC.1
MSLAEVDARMSRHRLGITRPTLPMPRIAQRSGTSPWKCPSNADVRMYGARMHGARSVVEE